MTIDFWTLADQGLNSLPLSGGSEVNSEINQHFY